jgi:hypothetical protein
MLDEHVDGMSVRDQFAALALPLAARFSKQGITISGRPNLTVVEAAGALAYLIADAMMKERKNWREELRRRERSEAQQLDAAEG